MPEINECGVVFACTTILERMNGEQTSQHEVNMVDAKRVEEEKKGRGRVWALLGQGSRLAFRSGYVTSYSKFPTLQCALLLASLALAIPLARQPGDCRGGGDAGNSGLSLAPRPVAWAQRSPNFVMVVRPQQPLPSSPLLGVLSAPQTRPHRLAPWRAPFPFREQRMCHWPSG